ncbi:MAG TPA: carboxypeptidase-like regulatory domain-containing protein [Terracidiphilus sp.]|nr:carboxypeptidase-like regulatory domain-containing protein [Terracidiphilus sp.]
MAQIRLNRLVLLALAAWCLRAPAPSQAQSAPADAGSLSGKLTDLHSAPLGGVSVVLRNVATGAETRTTTAKNGAYRFPVLDAGEYILEAENPQLGSGQLEGIVVSPHHEARVQTAMQLQPAQALLALTPAAAVAPNTASMRLPAETPTAPVQPMQPAAISLLRQLAPPPAPSISPLPLPALATVPEPVEQVAVLQPEPLMLQPIAVNGIDAVLHVGTPQVTPIISAVAKPDPATSAVSSTISAAEVQALPVSGRRWQDFLLDAPASTTPPGSAEASRDSADLTIDGANTRLAFGASALAEPRTADSGLAEQNASGSSPAWSGSRGLSVSEAGVHAVETVAGNVEAEGTRAAGGRLNLTTEQGGNALHGQGFFFDRQNNWGARNPFTQWVQNTGTASAPVFTPEPYTPPDHETVWGFGAGAPIRRNKLFWFAALDRYRRNDAGLATVKNPGEFFFVPTPNDAQIQLLSAQLGESENQAYNDYLGVPMAGHAAAGLEELASLLGPAPRTAAQWTGFARIDWQLAERHRLTLEGIGANWDAPGGGMTRVSATFGNHSFGYSHAGQQWLMARWEAYLTPNLLATTQASAGRDILSARPAAPSALEQTFLQGNVWSQLPQIVVDSRYGFTIGNPSPFGQGSYPDERLYHAQEMIDWVHNGLLLRAGFELGHNSDATSLLRNQTGTYYYSRVQDFISDALAFERFGLTNALSPYNPHNCGVTGTTFGPMPCYSYYSQTMGPTNWQLSTNDWASYATAQWQAGKRAVFSAGLRWDREQLPPRLATLANPDLTFTRKLPNLGNNWGPRVSMAIGNAEGHWPVLRLGYGLYYGRTENATIETALTQTGSPKGDLNFFLRPTDNCQFCAGGSPPFPYVFAGEPASVVKPGAVEFAQGIRNPEIHQAVASIEQTLPGHVRLSGAAIVSLGRRLPISMDTNFDPTVNPKTITYAVVDGSGQGPIKSRQITVPFYASWPSPTGTVGRLDPDYQQITEIMSRANSTYEAAMIRINRYGRRGLSLHAHYTYAHAMDWNPNETTLVAGSDVLDPQHFNLEYGTSNLDVRHSAAAMIIYDAPWKLHGPAGRVANGWMLSGIGQFRSGLPYTMHTSGSLAEEFDQATGAAIVGLAPGMNGSGGDNRVYGLGNDGRSYNIGRNTYRYPHTWKADLRLAKRFDLGKMRDLELMAESFNLFNHQNVTEIETTGYYLQSGSAASLPTLNFLTGLKPNTTAFGQPLNINATDFYRERQIELGLRMRF